MSDKWLEFRVSKPCPHTSDSYDGCPLCRITELEAQAQVKDKKYSDKLSAYRRFARAMVNQKSDNQYILDEYLAAQE